MNKNTLNYSIGEKEPTRWLAISGVIEIILLMGASIAVGSMLAQNISPGMVESLGLTTGADPDFWAATYAITLQLFAQYGVLFLLMAFVGLVRGRKTMKSYAFTKAEPQEGWLKYGIAVGLVVSIIPGIVLVLQDISPIGQDTPFWPILREAEWSLSFIVFAASSSFILVPIFEEMAWRGYVMGRLLEGFKPGAALIMTTLLFSVLHFQYLKPDAAMMLTFVGLTIGSFVLGYSALKTGSIMPAIIAHMIINFPLPTSLMAVKVLLGVGVIIMFRKAVWSELKALCSMCWQRSSLAVLPVFGGMLVLAVLVSMFTAYALYIGIAFVVLTIVAVIRSRSVWA